MLSSKRPTQNDVARLAGVSRGTVSYVINGLVDGKVSISPETRARVWEAVETLGYVPDAGAQALRSGATNTIGLIIPDLRNPHFWENAVGVEQEVRAAGYRLLLSSMDLDAEYGQDSFKDLSGRRIDALILMGAIVDQSEAAQEILAHCVRRRLPIVEISDRPVISNEVDSVVADYRQPALEAMAHLLGLGHRRIGLVCGAPTPDLIWDRVEPYQQSLSEVGIELDPDLVVNCGTRIEDGYAAGRQLLSLRQPPTAIMAINDLLAIGVLRAAGDAGLQVPQDLSLVGFDDIAEARYLVPRLTTSTKDGERMGREVARMVLARLQNPDMPRQTVKLSSHLLIRESTGPAKVPLDGALDDSAHRLCDTEASFQRIQE